MVTNTQFAGISRHEIGSRVKISGIVDPNDIDLNGKTGTLRHPFRKFPIQDVGIRLDDGTNVSVHLNEYELIKGE